MPHTSPPLQFPAPQPSPISSFANNFVKSFAAFQQLDSQKELLKAKQDQITLGKRKQDLDSSTKLISVGDELDPAKQKLLFNQYWADLGGDPASQSAKDVLNFFAKTSSETLAAMKKTFSEVGKNAPPGAVTAMMQAVAKGQLSFAEALTRMEKIGKTASTRQFLQAAGPGFSQTGGVGGAPPVRQRPLAPPGKQGEFGGFQPQVDQLTNAAGRALDSGNVEVATQFYDALTKVQNLAKREPAQSKIGRQIADLSSAEKEFGEGSFEAKAIRRSIEEISRPGASVSETSTMRAQYIGASKTFREALTASSEIDRIMTLGGSPASDLALITALVRITQPGGKISDADYRQAATIGSYGQRIKQWMQQAATGEGLLPGQRLDIQNLARLTLAARRGNHSKVALQFGALAVRNGVDPRDVVLDFEHGGTTSDKVDVSGLTPKDIAGMSIQDAKSLLLLPGGMLTEKQIRAIDARSRGIGLPGGS